MKGPECLNNNALEDLLTLFEKTEIEEFEEVWYLA
jgi:hypothetical protein